MAIVTECHISLINFMSHSVVNLSSLATLNEHMMNPFLFHHSGADPSQQ